MHGNPVNVGKLQKVVLLECFRSKGSRRPHGVLLPNRWVNLAFAIYSASENLAISKT